MRNFLPIKGPGGRALTAREKVALFVLGITLVLCVLTLLAGESAYADGAARNPVFALVAAISQLFGGGVLGFYALVVVWSGLIYFKGERIANISPIGGRLLAGCAVMVGISGALGIADNQTAGTLGLMVGGSLGSALGGAVGMVLLLGLMLIGVNLAGQGAWGALREPTPVPSGAGEAGGYSAAGPATPFEANSARMTTEPLLPDDGDPSPDERSHVVTQAMEEIERSHGVTIVDIQSNPDDPQVDPGSQGEAEETEADTEAESESEAYYVPRMHAETASEPEVERDFDAYYLPQSQPADEVSEDPEAEPEEAEVTEDPAPEPQQAEFDLQPEQEPETRSSIGEQVEAAPAPRPETPEAEIQRGLREVSEALAREVSRQPIEDGVVHDPFAPAPALDDEARDDLNLGLGADERAEVESEEQAEEEADDDDPNYYEPTYQVIEASPKAEAQEEEPLEPGFAATPPTPEIDDEEAESGFATPIRPVPAVEVEQGEAESEQADEGTDPHDPSDPYARGGLLRRLQQRQDASSEIDEPDRTYASYDWRGRPID